LKIPTLLQVIVTSYLFPNAQFALERLRALSHAIGKDRLVVDVRQVVLLLKNVMADQSNSTLAVESEAISGWLL
jgi:hypothetical protein